MKIESLSISLKTKIPSLIWKTKSEYYPRILSCVKYLVSQIMYIFRYFYSKFIFVFRFLISKKKCADINNIKDVLPNIHLTANKIEIYTKITFFGAVRLKGIFKVKNAKKKSFNVCLEDKKNTFLVFMFGIHIDRHHSTIKNQMLILSSTWCYVHFNISSCDVLLLPVLRCIYSHYNVFDYFNSSVYFIFIRFFCS